MDTFLLKDAIKNEKVYMLDNHYNGPEKNLKYLSVKGKIKILNFEKFKLDRNDAEENIDEKYFNNVIAKLEVEYTNLNYIENADITRDFYLLDENNNEYETIGTVDEMIAIANHLNKDVLDIHGYRFIPKISNIIELFYVIPNDSREYSFKLKKGEIQEL